MRVQLILATFFLLINVSWSLAGELKLSPVFSTAQDSPQFTVDFTNTSDRVVDLPKLVQDSSIVLDGQEYPLAILHFAGHSTLGPSEKWSYLFSLDSYLLGAQKRGFSKRLNRWRWQSAVKPGKHTIVLKFGGQQSASISFIWEPAEPLLYE